MDINSLAGQVSSQKMGSVMGEVGVRLLSKEMDASEAQASAIEEMLPPVSNKLLDVRA